MRKLVEKINSLQEENNRLNKLCLERSIEITNLEQDLDLYNRSLVASEVKRYALKETIKEAHKNIAAGSGYILGGEVDCICKICQEDY